MHKAQKENSVVWIKWTNIAEMGLSKRKCEMVGKHTQGDEGCDATSPGICSVWRWRQEDQKFNGIFSHIESVRLTCVTRGSVQNKQIKKTKQMSVHGEPPSPLWSPLSYEDSYSLHRKVRDGTVAGGSHFVVLLGKRKEIEGKNNVIRVAVKH